MKDLQKLLENETDAERIKRMAALEKRILEKMPGIKKKSCQKIGAGCFSKNKGLPSSEAAII